MEPLEFLGGKYQQPEQIVPGEVQTFTAREAATGRTVFVHRVSTAGSDAQQVALLRLVLLGIFRSPTARNQVLDFGEEPGFCYVVTESAPKCLLLREWLQFELDSAKAGGSAPAPAPAALADPVVDADPKPPVSRPASDGRETKAGGGVKPGPDVKPGPQVQRGGPVPFVIREQPVRPAGGQASAPPSPVAQPRVEFVKKEPTPIEPTAPQPTWEPATLETQPEPVKPKVEPVAPGPSQGEPGEFTRFFKGGLPPSAPSRPDAFRSQDRPSHGHGPVQRPSNPPSNPPRNEPGEFTKIFMKSGGEQAPSVAPPPVAKPLANPPPSRTGFPDSGGFGSNNAFDTPRVERLPDLSNRPSDLPGMFQMNAEAPTPMRSVAQEPGEYTRMFGKGGTAPPPQAPSAVGPLPSYRTDDPLGGTNFGMSAAPAAPPPQSGPSEFTRVMMGNRPPQEGGAGQGAPGMAAPPAGGAPAGMGAPPAMPAMGKPPAMPPQFAGMGGAPGAPAGGPAPMHPAAPMGHGGEPMGGAPMGGVRVTPMNPMYGMGGMGAGMGQASTNLGGMGTAGASMGNPMLGQAGHMGVMTPMGQAQMGGGSFQPMAQGGTPAGHPGAAGHAAGAPAMPGKFPGALPKAPTTGLGAKGKLLILFAVLGVLAVAMVLFVVFASHK